MLADDYGWTVLRLSDQQTLANFILQLPKETVPADLELASKNMTLSAWGKVSATAMPLLLLLAQNCIHSLQSEDGKETAVQQFCLLLSLIAQRHKITRLRQQPNTSSQHLRSRCSVFLMLKVLKLLTSVKLDNSVLARASRSLGASLDAISREELLEQTGPFPMAECQEAQALFEASVDLVLQVLQQVSENSSGAPAIHSWAMTMLQSLLPTCSSGIFEAAAHKMLSSGLTLSQ